MAVISVYKRWEEDQNREFLRALEYAPASKVVDLGCGTGDFTLRVREKIGCSLIYGVDLWEQSLKSAGKKGIEARKCNLNEDMPFDSGFFDVVVSNQVIEHLLYPFKFVREVHRILKKGGYCVISTENLSSWDNVIALMLGYTPFSMQFDVRVGNPISPMSNRQLPDYPPHIRIFAYQGLLDSLRRVGFKIERTVGSGYLPFSFLAKFDPRHARFITLKARK